MRPHIKKKLRKKKWNAKRLFSLFAKAVCNMLSDHYRTRFAIAFSSLSLYFANRKTLSNKKIVCSSAESIHTHRWTYEIFVASTKYGYLEKKSERDGKLVVRVSHEMCDVELTFESEEYRGLKSLERVWVNEQRLMSIKFRWCYWKWLTVLFRINSISSIRE